MTLEDIARISGYSRSTVSRVINGDDNVSEKARQKISEVIHRFEFQPNLAARGLASGRAKVLGLVIPMGVNSIFADPFFPLLIQGVSSGCNANDYSVMLWLAEPEYERRTITKILYNGLVDGVIVSSMLTDDPIAEALLRSKLPFLLIGRHPSHPEIDYVDVDNYSGARQAVLHLLRIGYQRIATIAGPQNMVVGTDRYWGYVETLQERGLDVQPELITEGDFTDAGGYEAMQRLLRARPDAVFAASDAMANGALRALHDAGLRVPEDVAVVGFDDVPFACRTSPALTTVRQPITRVGYMAAETLIHSIGRTEAEPNHVVLPTELVIRESCGANLKRMRR
ncbi:MAG: LacI family DNA-binding transcriptional regulator [Anaerolineaceae bacterium]|nr:LacI family DNA-binding transcriptional regulator [Anaerolineaceae bacterium]